MFAVKACFFSGVVGCRKSDLMLLYSYRLLQIFLEANYPNLTLSFFSG